MSNYFCQWPDLFLHRRDGSAVQATEALNGKQYVLLYFAASWSAPSRAFTKVLARFHEKYGESKNFEVVYISRDPTEKEMAIDFYQQTDETEEKTGADGVNPTHECSASGHGNYLAVPFAHLETVGVPLLYHFRIVTLPCLMVCDNRWRRSVDDEVLADDGKRATSSELCAKSSTGMPAPSVVQRDTRGRRVVTPRICGRHRVPQVITIAGRFMLESMDPEGNDFPWACVSSEVRSNQLRFFGLVCLLLLLTIALGVRFLPLILRVTSAMQGR